ncbi:hypothetical protein CNBG_9640 [Cryptococcus deuterogattii R265]|uniref:uncharacterized protein n=1 Tax=Cryptococcus deuterogattii (strain R265) TaxID=294750 RepID=UPI001937A8A0|nr:hypothetical protein CNBG_9640 [Cryptococcus deuterogattii R265]
MNQKDMATGRFDGTYDNSESILSLDKSLGDSQVLSALEKGEMETSTSSPETEKVALSQRRKWSLLMIFSLSMMVDVWSYSAFYIFTDPICKDLNILYEQQSWVITSYSVAFSSFLLFFGRVVDLYSAKDVFCHGFIAVGVLNLIISFLPDKFSFFVLRAVVGVAGSALVPAAFRLVVEIFEPSELSKAFSIYGVSGALGASTGVIIAGLLSYIPEASQSTPWRWFHRLMTALVLPTAGFSYWFIPPSGRKKVSKDPRWRRLDPLGALLMLGAVVALTIGLTFGASYGWKTPSFLVPFLLSPVLFILFFVYEAQLPVERAILPSQTWKIPNFTITIVFALGMTSWWAVNYLAFIQVFTLVNKETAIMAAVRLVPEAMAALAATTCLAFFPSVLGNARFSIFLGTLLGIAAYIMFAQSHTMVGKDYWRYIFSPMIFGSAGVMVAYTGVNVLIMTSVPSEIAGVAGSVLQVSLQVGSAVALSVQAGLLTIHPGSIYNLANVQASYYFQMGVTALLLIVFIVFYKPSKAPASVTNAASPITH